MLTTFTWANTHGTDRSLGSKKKDGVETRNEDGKTTKLVRGGTTYKYYYDAYGRLTEQTSFYYASSREGKTIDRSRSKTTYVYSGYKTISATTKSQSFHYESHKKNGVTTETFVNTTETSVVYYNIVDAMKYAATKPVFKNPYAGWGGKTTGGALGGAAGFGSRGNMKYDADAGTWTWSSKFTNIQTKSHGGSFWSSGLGKAIGYVVQVIKVVLVVFQMYFFAALLTFVMTLAQGGSFTDALTAAAISYVTAVITAGIADYLGGTEFIGEFADFLGVSADLVEGASNAFSAMVTSTSAATIATFAMQCAFQALVMGTIQTLVGGTLSYLQDPSRGFGQHMLQYAKYAYAGAFLAAIGGAILGQFTNASEGVNAWLAKADAWLEGAFERFRAESIFSFMNHYNPSGAMLRIFEGVSSIVMAPVVEKGLGLKEGDPLYYMVQNFLSAAFAGAFTANFARTIGNAMQSLGWQSVKDYASAMLLGYQVELDLVESGEHGGKPPQGQGILTRALGDDLGRLVGETVMGFVNVVVQAVTKEIKRASDEQEARLKAAENPKVTVSAAKQEQFLKTGILYGRGDAAGLTAQISVVEDQGMNIPVMKVTDAKGNDQIPTVRGQEAIDAFLSRDETSWSATEPVDVEVRVDDATVYMSAGSGEQTRAEVRDLTRDLKPEAVSQPVLQRLLSLNVRGVVFDNGSAFMITTDKNGDAQQTDLNVESHDYGDYDTLISVGTSGIELATFSEDAMDVMREIILAGGGRSLDSNAGVSAFLGELGIDTPKGVAFTVYVPDAVNAIPGVRDFQAVVTMDGVVCSFEVSGLNDSWITIKDAVADNLDDAIFAAKMISEIAAKYDLTIGNSTKECQGVIDFANDLMAKMNSGELRLDRLTVIFHGKFDLAATFTKGSDVISFDVKLADGLILHGKAKGMKSVLDGTFELQKIAAKYDFKTQKGIEGFLSEVVSNLARFGLTEMIFEFTMPGFSNLMYGFTQGDKGGFTAQYSFEIAPGIRVGHSGFAANSTTLKQSFAEMQRLKAKVDALGISSAKDAGKLGDFASLVGAMLLGQEGPHLTEQERVSGGEYTLSFKDGGNGKPLEYALFKKGDQIGIRTTVTLVDVAGREARLSFTVIGKQTGDVKSASREMMEKVAGVVNTAVEDAKFTSLIDPDKAGAFMNNFCEVLSGSLLKSGYGLDGSAFSLTLIKTTGLDAEVLHFMNTPSGWKIELQLSYFSKPADGDRLMKESCRIPMGSAEDAFGLVGELRKLEGRGIDAKFLTAKAILNYVNKNEAGLVNVELQKVQQEVLTAVFGTLLGPNQAKASFYGVVVRDAFGTWDLLTYQPVMDGSRVIGATLKSYLGRGEAGLEVKGDAKLPANFKVPGGSKLEELTITTSGESLNAEAARLAFKAALDMTGYGDMMPSQITYFGLSSWINVRVGGQVVGNVLRGVTLPVGGYGNFDSDKGNSKVYGASSDGKLLNEGKALALAEVTESKANDRWKKDMPEAMTERSNRLVAGEGLPADLANVAVPLLAMNFGITNLDIATKGWTNILGPKTRMGVKTCLGPRMTSACLSAARRKGPIL